MPSCAMKEPPHYHVWACRLWIWVGIAYNIGLSLILTYLVGLSLTYLNPPKARPTTEADEVAMRNKIHHEAVRRSRTQRRIKVRPRHVLCCMSP